MLLGWCTANLGCRGKKGYRGTEQSPALSPSLGSVFWNSRTHGTTCSAELWPPQWSTVQGFQEIPRSTHRASPCRTDLTKDSAEPRSYSHPRIRRGRAAGVYSCGRDHLGDGWQPPASEDLAGFAFQSLQGQIQCKDDMKPNFGRDAAVDRRMPLHF